MALSKWEKLTDEQKAIVSKFYSQENWDLLNDGARDRFADSVFVSELLSVPTPDSKDLPEYRKWKLPDLEKESPLELVREFDEKSKKKDRHTEHSPSSGK